MRLADETRWRGQSALASAVVLAAYWGLAWLLGEQVRPLRTGLAVAAISLPTLLLGLLHGGRRVREALMRAAPAPRASVHETLASARERRLRLAGAVLTGVIALLVFDHFTGGGGVMAGLLAGLMAAVGALDLVEARRWERAEHERESRIFVVVGPHALSPRLGVREIVEAPRPGRGAPLAPVAGPFDLGI